MAWDGITTGVWSLADRGGGVCSVPTGAGDSGGPPRGESAGMAELGVLPDTIKNSNSVTAAFRVPGFISTVRNRWRCN